MNITEIHYAEEITIPQYISINSSRIERPDNRAFEAFEPRCADVVVVS